MRNLIILVSTALTLSVIRAQNLTKTANQQNKTKRGLLEQTHYYGEPATIKFIHTPAYQDSASAAASPTSANYYSNPKPLVFHKGAENEPPKQVTVHQLLYEYQQTPHNAVSNVHVNQQFQTGPTGVVPEQRPFVPDAVHSQTTFPAHTLQPAQINPHFVNQPHVLHVEPNQFSGVATPVHHGAVINHGQGYSKLYYGPLALGHTTSAPLTQNHNNAAGKYVYANGKILYQPVAVNMHANNPYPGVTVPVRHHNLHANQGYPQRPPPPVTQKPFRPSPLIPITQTRYQTHPKPPVKHAEAPVKEEAEEEEDEKADVREEDEESESDDHAGYEEEDDDSEGFRPQHYSSKYRDDDDDDEDHDHYREYEGDEDEDNTRSYSRQVRKKPKKYTVSESKPGSRYQKNDHYKIKEGYKTNKKYSTEYKAPYESFKHDSSGKKPKGQYKSYKYYKSSSNAKPRKESIQGRQSQNVPIIHKQKLFHQEKWVVKRNESDL